MPYFTAQHKLPLVDVKLYTTKKTWINPRKEKFNKIPKNLSQFKKKQQTEKLQKAK